ncbi:hypothetical protein C4564_01125 [Candidatus Microgenomates bacterium]|nr:MAG: hypothetical protein C4564_01125 [Candidatus Microgenomates bacterium]
MANKDPNNIGKDDKGKDDDSWWGSTSSPNEHDGEHHTLYSDDGGRYSYDTDSDGGYVDGSGHGGGINAGEYQDD